LLLKFRFALNLINGACPQLDWGACPQLDWGACPQLDWGACPQLDWGLFAAMHLCVKDLRGF